MDRKKQLLDSIAIAKQTASELSQLRRKKENSIPPSRSRADRLSGVNNTLTWTRHPSVHEALAGVDRSSSSSERSITSMMNKISISDTNPREEIDPRFEDLESSGVRIEPDDRDDVTYDYKENEYEEGLDDFHEGEFNDEGLDSPDEEFHPVDEDDEFEYEGGYMESSGIPIDPDLEDDEYEYVED